MEDEQEKDVMSELVEIVTTTPPPKPKPNTQVVTNNGTIVTLEETKYKTKDIK